MSYASYRHILREMVKFWPKIKIPLALDIKNWGFQLKMAMAGSQDKKKHKKLEHWPLTKRSIGSWTGRPVRRGWEFKEPPTLYFLHYSPPFLQGSSHFRFQRPIWARSWTKCRPWSGFWDDQRLGLRIWDLRLSIQDGFSLVGTSQLASGHSHAPRAFRCVWFSLYQLRLPHFYLSDGA